MQAGRCMLYTTMGWAWRCRKWKSRIAFQNLRYLRQIHRKNSHRRAFVSCSRVKSCNFSGFVNISSEIFLEKLSPLNELRNYGDRRGKLDRVRKHQSHQAAPLRWLARRKFSGQSEGGNFSASGTGSVRVSAQGSSRSYSKLSPRIFYRPD